MQLTVENSGDIVLVTVHGDHLDASASDEFKRDLAPLLDAHTKVVLDMSELRFVDSAGIDGDLKLCGVTKPVRASFEIARMHRIIDILDTREEALAAFAAE